MDILPTQTLYVNNINEKIKKDVVKKMLYMVFSQYGKVVKISVSKALKLKGQAWVVYQDVAAATSAMRGKQGFNFYGKALKIAYAKANTTLGGKKDSTASGKRKRDVDDDAGAMAPSMRAKGEQVLVVQNLPSEVGETSLVPVFSQCTGFTEVRMAPGSKGLAFVEFSDEVQASMALKQLQGFQITESYSLDISVGNGK